MKYCFDLSVSATAFDQQRAISKSLRQSVSFDKASDARAGQREIRGGEYKVRTGLTLLFVFYVLLFFTWLSASGQEFQLSGKISVEILSAPPYQNYPRGSCVVPFSVFRASNSWHMKFQMPTNYSGDEYVIDRYSSVSGEVYSVMEVRQPAGPGKVFYTAGVAASGDPFFLYSSCAPMFLVWLSYLRDRDSFESIPRLFYDHRANFTRSSPSCRGIIQATSGNIIREVQFKELGKSNACADSWASYRITEFTNINEQAIASAFELDAYIRIPIIIDDKLLLEDGWVDASHADTVKTDRKVILGARYRATLEKIVLSNQSIALPPPLNPGVDYEIVDSRFGKSMDLSNAVVCLTNRWLARDEAFQLYKRQQASMRQQPISGDFGKISRPIVVFLCLSSFAIFWLMYAAKKREQQTTNNKT